MGSLEHLLEHNRRWSANIRQREPDFFVKLARQQSPNYLWIGCSDSRVPANEIVDLLPGELFVHRNVANVVVHSDLNCLSVMQYAVDVLEVKHLIVCGHYGCGGVRAALLGERLGLIDNWLHHVRDVFQKHQTQVLGLPEETQRIDRLCELNVIEQVVHVCQTTVVHDAWARGQQLAVHGWIYGLRDGRLHTLMCDVSGPGQLEAAYQEALAVSYPAP